MQISIPDHTRQILFVLGDSYASLFGDAFLLERVTECWKVSAYDRIEVGKQGWTDSKQEGDMKSPIGVFQPLFFFGKQHWKQHSKFPFLISHENLVAVDDVNSDYYNRILDKRTVDQIDWSSCEQLQREDHLYDITLVADINYLQPVKGKGSCLFHHIKRGKNQGTEGCIAYSYVKWIEMLSKLQPKFAPFIIQGPREVMMPELQQLNIQF